MGETPRKTFEDFDATPSKEDITLVLEKILNGKKYKTIREKVMSKVCICGTLLLVMGMKAWSTRT